MKINHWVIAAGWIFIVSITVFLLWQLPGVLREGHTKFGQPDQLYYLNLVSWILIVAFLLTLRRHPQASKILMAVWLILVLSQSIWGYLINYISSGRLILRILGSFFVVWLTFSYVARIGRDSHPGTHNKMAS